MQPNQTIRLQASGIMIAGQAAFEVMQKNLLLGTLTRPKKVEDQIVAVKYKQEQGLSKRRTDSRACKAKN